MSNPITWAAWRELETRGDSVWELERSTGSMGSFWLLVTTASGTCSCRFHRSTRGLPTSAVVA